MVNLISPSFVTTLTFPAVLAEMGSILDSSFLFIAILIPAFLFKDQKKYGFGLLFVLFTMIDNYYLKSLFQIPLAPPLEGWAFPSGHMHSAFIFWGWLASQRRNYGFTALVGLILTLVAFGLVFHGYHYPIDIIGAIAFGTCFLILFHFLAQAALFKQKPYHLGTLLGLVGFILIQLIAPESRKPHLWQALGGILGFSLGWSLLPQMPRNFTIKQKIAKLLFTLSGSAILFMGLNALPLGELKIFTQFFMIGAWISISSAFPYLLRFILTRRKTPALMQEM